MLESKYIYVTFQSKAFKTDIDISSNKIPKVIVWHLVLKHTCQKIRSKKPDTV